MSTTPQTVVAAGCRITLVRDFRNQPHELFDGLEPAELVFQPASLGLSEYQPVDLVAACSERPDRKLPAAVQCELESVVPSRVVAFDKSASRQESLLGYYAIANSSSHRDRLIILFSFFEVSPGRFHAYLHGIYKLS